MDAIILVGGQGTRLRPLTARRHKSLLPLGERRVFDYLLDWVRKSEIERVVLALGRNNEDLAAAYPPGHHVGLTIDVVIEREPLQSGGAIRNAVHEGGVEGRFLVLNGDVFVDFPFQPMLDAHASTGADLSIALHEEVDVSQFGVATIDRNSMITRFVEKSAEPPSRLVNAGVWIFEPRLVREIAPGPVRVEDTLFPGLVAMGRPVRGHLFNGLWADVGTPARYLALAMSLADQGRTSIHPGIHLGRGAVIERSFAGPACRLATGAKVQSSVLWEGVEIGDGARVEDSILADGVLVGEGAYVRGCVAGPGAVIAPGVEVTGGTVIEADATFGGQHD